MIWQCADCGHQVVQATRPTTCPFCGPDVEFFVFGAKEAGLNLPRSVGHLGGLAPRPGPDAMVEVK